MAQLEPHPAKVLCNPQNENEHYRRGPSRWRPVGQSLKVRAHSWAYSLRRMMRPPWHSLTSLNGHRRAGLLALYGKFHPGLGDVEENSLWPGSLIFPGLVITRRPKLGAPYGHGPIKSTQQCANLVAPTRHYRLSMTTGARRPDAGAGAAAPVAGAQRVVRRPEPWALWPPALTRTATAPLPGLCPRCDGGVARIDHARAGDRDRNRRRVRSRPGGGRSPRSNMPLRSSRRVRAVAEATSRCGEGRQRGPAGRILRKAHVTSPVDRAIREQLGKCGRPVDRAAACEPGSRGRTPGTLFWLLPLRCVA